MALRDFRSYERLELELADGLVLVAGPNGSGKTNLVEAVHVGTQAFSPRTRADAQLIRFGRDGARVALEAERRGNTVSVEVAIVRKEGKRVRLNGAALAATDQLRNELPTLVFTPDRLVVIKGGPAVRRAYIDRTLARLLPTRAALPRAYGEALGQRNACLRGIKLGFSSNEALAPWSEQVAKLGSSLQAARLRSIEMLSPRFAEVGAALGLPECRLEYSAEPLTIELLEQRLARDLERGTTGAGPHLDEIVALAKGRELRSFGSQGEQRTAVLALLLAEAELLTERDTGAPLLLLDDVLSELDMGRREALAERLKGLGQTIITATSESALPEPADQVVLVSDGSARTL
ncbi:MAG: DNA replication/repair protein RecF [Gaiellaceae bacterium]